MHAVHPGRKCHNELVICLLFTANDSYSSEQCITWVQLYLHTSYGYSAQNFEKTYTNIKIIRFEEPLTDMTGDGIELREADQFGGENYKS